MQVGERLDNHTVGLLEPLRALRLPLPTPNHAMFYATFLDLNCSSQRCSQAIASARRQSAATEQLSGERCKHLSQMTEMPDDSRAVRLAMSRIQAVARSDFAGRHPVPSVALYI